MTLHSLVDHERRVAWRAEITSAALRIVAAVLLLLAAGAAILGRSRWIALPRGLPFAVWIASALIFAFIASRARMRLRHGTSAKDVAHVIENEQGLRRGVLIGALEVEGSGALGDLAASAARKHLPAGAPLAPDFRKAGMRRTIVGASVAVASVLVLLSATPVFGDGLRAVLEPISAWRGTLLPRPSIEHAPQELLRGSPLSISVLAPGRRFVYLTVRQTGDAWRTDTITVDPTSGLASWKVEALRSDLRIVASDGRTSSDSITVRAADRPFVGAVTLRAHYPAYLSRADESLPVGEPLHVPRGTVVQISGRASVALADVSLNSAGGTRVLLAAEHQTFRGQFVPERTEELRWSAKGPGGLVPDLPEPLSIEVVADSAPHVEIAEPATDTLLVNAVPVTLLLRAADDHGIATIALHILRASTRDAVPVVKDIASVVGTSWAGPATVFVDSLRLAPGEALSVRAEAVDGSPWHQRSVSREIVLRRATSEEQRSAARSLADSTVKEAVAAANAQKSLANRTDDAAKEQARRTAAPQNGAEKGAMKFENAEKAKALAKEQRAMTEKIDKLRAATKQLEEQLKAASALDTSLARQLNDAQNLLRQALTPEMLAQMAKLESSAQQMNGEQSRDALRDMAQMQQKMREQLEKSSEMLKRAAHEGSMQTLRDEAKELAQKERDLSQQLKGEQGAAPQDAKSLADRSERLQKAMEQLKDRLEKDKASAGAEKTKQAEDHAKESEDDLRKAAQQIPDASPKPGDEKKSQGDQKSDGGQQKAGSDQKSGGEQKAGGDQKSSGDPKAGGEQKSGQGQQKSGGNQQGAQAAEDAANEMERAAEAMQDARRDQVKEWKKELTSELDQSVQEMMQLAREERSLEQKTREGASNDDKRAAQSAVEQGVDKANERLQNAGKKSSLLSSRSQKAMQEAKEKVSQATQSVSQPNGAEQKQANALGEAADALTRAAGSLARDRERANSANSASGFSEMLKQMQEMAQQQGQINGQSQQLMSMPNAGQTQQGQSLSRSLARQERQLAEKLDETSDPAGGDRAAKLAQEARQVAEALDNGRLDASTLARQQQLFRRMLDAGKSLEKEERDDNGKREAKSATGEDAFSPNAKVDARAALKFKPPTWQELRALSADERKAILDYFTRLNSAGTP